ncbi:MAG TPA: RHS repeat-associated core domain-containing protein [Terriglobales bacterium]|jgi:RHS repeat-associated protein|nr:RHS repeat-associated core domain-containing protein [Terriglobales bacterium]
MSRRVSSRWFSFFFVLVALSTICISLPAHGAVRQVASAQTPNINCTYTPSGGNQYAVACDPLPPSLTVNFSPTLAGSEVLLAALFIDSDGTNTNTTQSPITGCTDNLGQAWAANGNQINPPNGGTLVGLTSITCQFTFPNYVPSNASSASGQWGALDLQFVEVTGIPQGSVINVSQTCSLAPPLDAISLLIDYTGTGNGYTPQPTFGNFGVPGAADSSLLTLTYSGQNTPFQSVPFYFTSIYATVGDQGPTGTLSFPGATQCQAVIFPQAMPEDGTNLGDCDCDGAAGLPINLTTGNVFIKKEDYSIPGLGGGVKLDRTWNSLWAESPHADRAVAGMFGDSWTSNYEDRIVQVDGFNVVDYWGVDGRRYRFTEYIDVAGLIGYNLTTPQGEGLTLLFNGTAQLFQLSFPDGTGRNFSPAGLLVSFSDHWNNKTTLTYDQAARVTTATDAASRSLTFVYGDPVNTSQVTSVQDAVGTVATYTYDSSQRLTKVSYPDGSFNTFNYDSASRILSVTDTEGKILESHTYDANSRGLTSSRAGGAEGLTVAYDKLSSGASTLTDSLGRTTQYNFSPFNLKNAITGVSGSGCVTCGGRGNQTFGYNGLGQRTTSTDPLGNTTQFTYETWGGVDSRSITVNGSPVTWKYTYGGSDSKRIATITDPLGNVTTYNYTNSSNQVLFSPTSITTPAPNGSTAASKTSFTYSSNGELLTITDPLLHVTTLTYTPAGLVQTIKDAQGKITTLQYDQRGNRTAVIDALNQQTTFAYDSMNRLTSITYPTTPATSTVFTYDTRGRRTSVTDPNQKTTTYTYDDADRLTAVTDPQNGMTQYAYDTENNLTSITDAAGHITQYDHDAQGRVTQTTFPSSLIETYIYDAKGNLTSKTDRKNQTITYNYDPLGRLTSKAYPDSTQVNYTYDAASRLTTVTDPTGTYTYTYDNMGRLVQTSTVYSFISGKTFTVKYGYDAASNRISMTDPQNAATAYVFDTLNRITTLTYPSRTSYTFTYDVLGRRTQLKRPNGLATNYQYDPLSRITSILHQTGSKSLTTLDGATYVYDPVGNRTSRADKRTNVTSTFSYDPLYELTQVLQGATTTESYTYDSVGNRLSSLGVSPYNYDVSNELTSTPGATYTYDGNGNMSSKATSSGTTQYNWDIENRLMSVVLPGSGGTVNFKYDPTGRRIQKSSLSGTTNYVYDAANILEEVDATGNVLVRYVQSPAIDQPLAETRGSTTSYYQADGLGSITSLSNSSAALVNTYTYDSYGKLTASSGTTTNVYRYAGREFDSETGMYFNRARYYDATTGRFTSEDRLRFESGLNFFTYGQNNPLVFADPSGLTVQIVGNPDTVTELQAAYNSVNSTAWGKTLINTLENSPTLYLITNLQDGTSFYDPNTNIISVDPNFHPEVAVDNGKTCSVERAPTNAVLGHEIGHAATGIHDDGPGNMNNVNANENQIRRQLGLPLRLSYP